MITFKQKLTAIKESINRWDTVRKGEIIKLGGYNCPPLCLLYEECARCPVYEKTREYDCMGTPFVGWYDNPTPIRAAIFRDWLKDLYIEVSEAGDGESEVKTAHPLGGNYGEIFCGKETNSLEERVKKLEKDFWVVYKEVRNLGITHGRITNGRKSNTKKSKRARA